MDSDSSSTSRVVAEDLACKICGYNLRGLERAGQCPECAEAILRSLQGDFLCFADPAWLRILRRGALWRAAAMSMAIVLVPAVFLFGNGPSDWLRMLSLANGLFEIGGIWLLTTPDPSGSGERSYGTARGLARFGAITSLGLEFLRYPLIAAYVGEYWPTYGFMTLLRIADLIGSVAELRYLAKLATRLPSRGLARSSRQLSWAAGFVFTAALVLYTAATLTQRLGGPKKLFTLFVGLWVLAAGIGLLLMAAEVVLFLSFARRLHKETAIARRAGLTVAVASR